MSSETIPEYSEKVNSMYSSISIDVIVTKLRVTIDRLDIHFDKAKSLISELAIQLDESKECKQSQICRKIKELLEDKIKEGKISEKWIEECLPQKYKRKYANKSEVSSLSKQGKEYNITTTGQEKEKELIATDSGKPYIKTDDTLASNYGEVETASATNNQLQEGLNKKEIINHGVEPELNAEALSSENYRLKEALAKATQFTKDDQISINEIEFTIPKEKYEHVKAAMDNSRDSIFLIFDKSGILERAESDVLKETKK
jgi:hypothetical protein